MSKSFTGSLVAVLALASVTACSTPPPAPAPGAAPAAPAAAAPADDKGPIKVGILHSLSGTMAISETSLKDVALMTIEEINKAGGGRGRYVMKGGGVDGDREDQRGGRRHGRQARAGGGRSGLQLAALRREGPRP